MTPWIDTLKQVESLEHCSYDAELVAAMQGRWRRTGRQCRSRVRFYSPTFRRYQTGELRGPADDFWPAVSITGSDCKLQCDHCKARILEPMRAARTPEALWRLVNELIGAGAAGMLLTGGSNLANKVDYAPFYKTLESVRDAYPQFRIAAHTGLVDAAEARALEECGIEVAMLDIIGAQETITQVYHLRRTVEHFEASLQALVATSMRVVPHIVMGLHYGRLLGEWNALDVIARNLPDAVVFVVVSPIYASARRPFETPSPHTVGRFLMNARERLAETPLLLGCMRPPGVSRTLIDSYALLSGLDGIAHPADGLVELALRLERQVLVSGSCCSMLACEGDGRGLEAVAEIDAAGFLAILESGGLQIPSPSIGGIPVVADPERA